MQVWDFIQADGQRHRHYDNDGRSTAGLDLIEQADKAGEGAELRCECGAMVTSVLVDLPDKYPR